MFHCFMIYSFNYVYIPRDHYLTDLRKHMYAYIWTCTYIHICVLYILRFPYCNLWDLWEIILCLIYEVQWYYLAHISIYPKQNSFVFDNIYSQMPKRIVGKPCETLVRIVSSSRGPPADLDTIVSLQFTFAVTINMK